MSEENKENKEVKEIKKKQNQSPNLIEVKLDFTNKQILNTDINTKTVYRTNNINNTIVIKKGIYTIPIVDEDGSIDLDNCVIVNIGEFYEKLEIISIKDGYVKIRLRYVDELKLESGSIICKLLKL